MDAGTHFEITALGKLFEIMALGKPFEIMALGKPYEFVALGKPYRGIPLQESTALQLCWTTPPHRWPVVFEVLWALKSNRAKRF